MYILCWSAACLAALCLAIREWKAVALSRGEYWRFLFNPWRATTFAIASSGMIIIAPFTGDPTWDYVDAFFMSVLTYVTAPWAIGALYNVFKRKLKPSQAFIALCVWMFSASWSYDLYLVFRDGDYPLTWCSNIFASSVLYASAGLFWSLDWIQERGVTFAFMESSWPYRASGATPSKLVLFMLPFIALVSFLILYFFWFKAGR
ncbi:MAG: hypothetical protein AB1427_21720 [Thermodesulfobacteriota bacterium]